MEREWFWRFLAGAMLFVVGWAVWIAVQIRYAPLATPAAFEAEARARASREAKGPIGRPPPVNAEKLKMSESIATPIVEAPAGK